MSQHFAPSDKATLPARLSVKVVGLTFHGDYPENLIDLQRQRWEHNTYWRLQLVREPDNQYDRNAVGVKVAADEELLGHLPAGLAGRIAPEMDAGVAWVVTGWDVLVMPGHEDRPGLAVSLMRSGTTS